MKLHEDQTTPVVCRACERKVTMGQIKFDETRKQFVCQNCYNATHPAKKTDEKPSFEARNQENRKTVEETMEKYNCTKCKYYFSRKKGKEVSACPYCGSSDITRTTGTEASKILDESERYF